MVLGPFKFAQVWRVIGLLHEPKPGLDSVGAVKSAWLNPGLTIHEPLGQLWFWNFAQVQLAKKPVSIASIQKIKSVANDVRYTRENG